MLVNIIKFLHLLLTLSLLGSTLYGFILIGSPKASTRLNKIILILAFFAMLTGTLLVYPKHFTFHTPWIQAAYLFIVLFALGITLLIVFRNKQTNTNKWVWRVVYLLLLIILFVITHDAVIKTTFGWIHPIMLG